MNKNNVIKPKSMLKKTKIVKKSISKKPVNNKGIVKKSSVAKNSKQKKISIPKKRIVLSKKLKSLQRLKIFIVVSLVIIVAAMFFVVNPQIGLQDNLSNSSVLSVNSTSNNTYSVSEDDLLMFATLAYETPSVVIKPQNPFHLNDPNSTISTHYNPDATPTQLITRCPEMVTNITVSKPISEEQRKCLVDVKETPKDDDDNSDYMYTKENIVGSNYEAKLKKENINSVSDIPLHFAQWAFTALIGKNPGEEYYFSGLANLDAANSEFGNLRGWDAVEFFESPTQGDGNDYGLISAVTFKKGHDIVIAYRGTDLTDAIDWVGIDGSYALKNNTKQDELAKKYALRIGKAYNEGNTGEQYRIYVTGHSLGGYLAQIAASGLLQLQDNNTVSNPYNLTRVVYFNGMGLFFSSKSIANSSNGQIATRDKLLAFNTTSTGEKDDKLLFVHMFGDVVSSLGIHYGQYKELHVANNAVQSQNIFYVLSPGMFFDKICDTLKIDSYCEAYRNTEKYKNLVPSSRNKILSFLGKAMSDIKINFNTSQLIGSADEQIAKGEPYNGVLAYIMSTHKTNSFFYTKYYEDMVKNYGNSYKYGANNVDLAAESPQLANIASADGPIDSSITWGSAGAPLCTFNSNYSSTHNVTFIDKPGQTFEAEYLKSDKVSTGTSGRIICNSKYGLKDIEISRSTDIYYKDDYRIGSWTIASVTIDNNTGKQLVDGDSTAYYWDVTIKPRLQAFSRTKVRLGKITDLYLRSGAVVANNDITNENIPFNHIIQTTNSNTVSPVLITDTQQIAITPTVVSPESKPVCAISVPTDIVAKSWPFYKYYSATISCISSVPLIDKTILSRDIISSPSGRLIISSVSSASVSDINSKYYYRWIVKVRGARSSTGSAKLILNSNSISNTAWVNSNLLSNTIYTNK